jgi:hypothetical protein
MVVWFGLPTHLELAIREQVVKALANKALVLAQLDRVVLVCLWVTIHRSR